VTRKEAQTVSANGSYKIAAFDYGIKQNIINNFVQRGCTLRIFPAEADLEEVKAWKATGIFLAMARAIQMPPLITDFP
jgi:carbamoyl-phosphate synthase small subunit